MCYHSFALHVTAAGLYKISPTIKLNKIKTKIIPKNYIKTRIIIDPKKLKLNKIKILTRE